MTDFEISKELHSGGEDGIYAEYFPTEMEACNDEDCLERLAEKMGYEENAKGVDALIEAYMDEDIVPGICIFCMNTQQEVDAYADGEICPFCNHNGVYSVMKLGGVL